MIKDNKNSYNKIASQWNEDRNKTKLHKYVLEFESHLKRNAYVLDLGCGTGYPNITYLNKKGHFVYGIDISEEMIKYAIDLKLDNTNFELINFLDFNHDKKFDGILAFDSLFHLPLDKHVEAFKKISNLINAGGYFGKEKVTVKGQMYSEQFYYSTLNSDETIKLLIQEGFEIVESIIDYKDEFGHRELIVIARKL